MISQRLIDESIRQLGGATAEARIKEGLTQEQFAAKAGVSSHTLLDFEAGRGGGISFRNLHQLLSAAGIEASIGANDVPVDYIGMYLAPWNDSERNRISLRVGDTPERARKRLEKKRKAIYGR